MTCGLGKEQHDWLLGLPLTDARLVSTKPEVLRLQHTAVSLP